MNSTENSPSYNIFQRLQLFISKYKEVLERILISFTSILFAIITGSFVLTAMGYDPINTYEVLLAGSLTDPSRLANIFFNATPLIFTGLSVAVAFRAGMFNIGTEGQLLFGGFLSTLVGFKLVDYGLNKYIPFFIAIPLLLVVGMIGGAVWAFIPAYLKAKKGVHEVITTIMLNYVAYTLMVFLAGSADSPFIDRDYVYNPQPQTPPIMKNAWLPRIFDSTFSQVHYGIFIALITSIVIYILLWQTKWGYEVRSVGNNTDAAEYGGIEVSKNLISVMLVSGALGGLAGTVFIMGSQSHRFLWTTTHPLFGFDGIAVSIIGGNHPIGAVFGALLFGWLKVGGQVIQGNNMPKEIAGTIQALIVFFVAIPLISKSFYKSIYDYGEQIKEIFKEKAEAIGAKDWLYQHSTTIITLLSLISGIIILVQLETLLHQGFSDEIRALILTLLFIAFIGLFFTLNNPNIEEKSTLGKIRNFKEVLIFYIIVLFIYDFPLLIKIFDQEIVMFGSMAIVTVIIFILEFKEYVSKRQGNDIPQVSLKTTQMESDEQEVIKPVRGYLILCTTTLIFTIVISVLVNPILAIVATLILILLYVILNTQDWLSFRYSYLIYYLNYIFYLFVFLFTFQMSVIVFDLNPELLFRQTLIYGVPIAFAALAGVYSEKTGVINIGLEGMMLAGAFMAVLVTEMTKDPWMGVMGAIILGFLMGLLHAVASIKYRADQVVVGVALNLLAASLTALGLVFFWQSAGNSDPVKPLEAIDLSVLGEVPIIGQLLFDYGSGYKPLVYIFIFLFLVSAWIIQRTSFGLRMRAVGEHPKAADTLGVNVFKVRYIGVIISGILASLGGAQLTLGIVSQFGKGMTTGRGYMGLAALIFGGWNAVGASLASFLFSFSDSAVKQLNVERFRLFGLAIFKLAPAVPYLFTLVAVALLVKRMRAPAADGIPYVKEE